MAARTILLLEEGEARDVPEVGSVQGPQCCAAHQSTCRHRKVEFPALGSRQRPIQIGRERSLTRTEGLDLVAWEQGFLVRDL